MVVDWSAECGADDPVLVVPWSSPAGTAGTNPGGGLEFVDLRENPYDLDRIPEAEQHPPLMQALRALNAARSPVFTAKCDAWAMDPEELMQARDALDLQAEEAAHGFVSYVDIIWRERALFVSFHQGEQRVMRMARLLEAVDEALALVDCVLRPALVDLSGPQEGFATSLYVKALGTDAAHAYERWAKSLATVVTLLRSRELAGA